MRALLFLSLPLLVAACQTPRESCISAVTREGRVIDGLIAETRGNLARGYAIEERQELETRREFCEVRNDEGTVIGRSFCDRSEVDTVRVPVTIDLEAERVKLDQLLLRQSRLDQAQQAAIGQCVALNPE